MIPYGRQDISESDVQMVTEVLRSDFLTQGPMVPKFEASITKHCGSKYAIAVNSATSALHIACLALGLKEGDVLWTSPISFVASANCGLYCGASVDFVDIDPDTYNLCPRNLAKKLLNASKNGGLPKIVVAVHLSGQPCDMEKIYALSIEYGFKVIEDASHAIGGYYNHDPIGNCKYSDITVFSFHPVKIITTAEGGCATTNNPKLAEKLLLLRSHGITRDSDLMHRKSHGGWYYEQIELGFNYRMPDVLAALGVSQMKRLDDFVAHRHRLFDQYQKLLLGLPITLPHQLTGTYSGMHLYIIRLKLQELSNTHREIFNSLRKNNIGVNLHYIPIYRHPFFKKMGFSALSFPNAEAYYREAISLPMFQSMTDCQQREVVCVLQSLLVN